MQSAVANPNQIIIVRIGSLFVSNAMLGMIRYAICIDGLMPIFINILAHFIYLFRICWRKTHASLTSFQIHPVRF